MNTTHPTSLASTFLTALAASDAASRASSAAGHQGPAFAASVAAGDVCLAAARALVASGEQSETAERAAAFLRGYESVRGA